MSNILYIDANRQNSNFTTDENNEWQTKLNTEHLLPKGTQIQIQTSFINKKGINGGSIEIDEDIVEEISYYLYITEQAHIVPTAEKPAGGGEILTPWFRGSLACSANTFRGNFNFPCPVEPISDIVYGSLNQDPYTPYNDTYKTPDFMAYGGSNAILPHCQWQYSATTHPITNPQVPPRAGYTLTPQIKTLKISVPKGVYGIGELGQLIEDQFNGIKFYDEANDVIIDKADTYLRRDDADLYNVDANNANSSADIYDGQPYNRPFLQEIDVMPRYYQTDYDEPSVGHNIGADAFLNMEDFKTMVDYSVNVNSDMSTHPNQSFSWWWMRGNPQQDNDRIIHPNLYPIRPFYLLRQNYDTDAVGSRGANEHEISHGHTDDSVLTRNDYNLYGYASGAIFRKKLIGTTNFTFKYDAEKNGFSINGLHNCMRSMSHDRFGSKIASSGQTVINFKKVRSGGTVYDGASAYFNTPALKEIRNKIIGSLNSPETRDGGVMIVNWGLATANKNKTTNKNIFNTELAQFQDFFTSEEEAQEVWKTTLWYRLGFDFEQLCKSNGTNIRYNKDPVPDYGFTTDVQIDNTIVSTLSTLNNPMSYKPAGSTDADAGFQLFNTMNMAIPNRRADVADVQGLYANSPYYECAVYPVIIADVGGIVAKRLPTLTKHPYFLITTDLCDNYKDNVKKGDVLPLIGVVPKTSLSNQDFITAENQIVQVLSQDKIINNFNIKILNPDLTAPQLEENSSIILKLTLPNITPLSLLENDPTKKQIVQQIQATQNELVGN